MRRRRISSRSRGPRRKLTWGDSFWGATTFGVAAGNSLIYEQWIKTPAGVAASGNTLDWHEPIDQTLVRSYNRFGWAVQPSTAKINAIVAAGIIVMEWQDGLTVPPLAGTPFPVDLADDADWVWKEVFPVVLPAVGNTAAAALNGGDMAYWSRAQRKLSSRAGLLLVVQCLNNLTGNSIDFEWNFYGRYLFKEP